MPSTKDPGQIGVGAGKLHSNVATAAADFQTSSGTSSLLAAALAALNQELAVVTRAGQTGIGQTSVTLDGSINAIWLGDGSGSSDIEDYFRLVIDPDNRSPVEADGTPIYITGITGAFIGDGWYTGSSLQVNFSAAIFGGQFWQVYYTNRVTLQSLPADAFSYPSIRNTLNVRADLIEVLRELHQASGSRDWDDAWLSTIDDLTKSGLNERYRLSTTGSGGTVDTPGEGALIHRDGQAVTLEASAQFGYVFYPNAPSDPYMAHHKTTAGPASPNDSSDRINTDGGTGFVNVQQQRLTPATQMRLNAQAYSLASRMDVIERHFSAALIGTANVRTKVNPLNTTGTALNPTAATGFNDRREIELGTGDYFWEAGSGNKTSEVAIGRDLIEITYAGGETQVCVISELDPANSRRAKVLNLTGGGLSFPSGVSTPGASFRFIKTKYWQGVGTQRYQYFKDSYLVTPNIELGQFYHAVTPFIADDLAQSGEAPNIGSAEFYARARTVGNSGVTGLTAVDRPMSLIWGGYDPETWTQEPAGALRGDGGVEATIYGQRTRVVEVSASGATVIDWHPSLEGAVLLVNLTHASGVAALTINIDIADYMTYQKRNGDTIEVYVQNPPNAPTPGAAAPSGATYTITWGGAFSFESGTSPGGLPIFYNISGRRTVNKWTATFCPFESDFIMRDVTHYIGAGD